MGLVAWSRIPVDFPDLLARERTEESVEQDFSNGKARPRELPRNEGFAVIYAPVA